MTTLALSEVCDPDCIASTNPLELDRPSTERYVRGADAILRRILYAWIRGGLLTLEGSSLSRADIVLLRGHFEALAEAEDYVLGVDLVLDLDDASGVLTISAAVQFVTGRTYEFEVTAGAAASLTFPEAA